MPVSVGIQFMSAFVVSLRRTQGLVGVTAENLRPGSEVAA